MLDQLLGALLFLFGFQSGGKVRGESTPSAATAASTLKPLVRSDMMSLEKKFAEKLHKARLNWETKHASFTAALAGVKDEKKKARMETLQTRLTQINTNQTTLLMNKLKHLDAGLTELYKAAQSYGLESGKDLSGVSSSIESANKAIADATSKVTAQAEKTYIITITSETNLKNDFGKTRATLSSDLKKVRDSVQEARKKVGEALKALKSAMGKPVNVVIRTDEIPLGISGTATPTPNAQ